VENVFIQAVFTSLAAAVITLAIASVTCFFKTFEPIDQTGSDDDYLYTKSSVIDHMCEYGLIYPVVYFYSWLGFWMMVYREVCTPWIKIIC